MTDWMPGVERIETAAQGGPIEPRGVMSHIMQGYQSTMIAWARQRPMRTTRSAHFTVGRDGRIVQHVSIRRQAWHAGRLDSTPPTWPLLPQGGNPNDYAVGIEHEGFSGQPWPWAQVEASIRVQRWLFEELGLEPSEDTVIGHYMTAPESRRHDPGSGWPRERILGALRTLAQSRTLSTLREAMTQDEWTEHALSGYWQVQSHRATYEVEDGEHRVLVTWR